MLAGFGRTSEILSQVSAPTLHSPNYGLSQSDSDVPSEDSSVISAETDVDWGTLSISDGDFLGKSENLKSWRTKMPRKLREIL